MMNKQSAEQRAAYPRSVTFSPEIGPQNDPWDPIHSLKQNGKHLLTSVELTVTNLCNMRCEHCAVGETLSLTEGARVPLADVLRRLDEVEHLQTVSITGGEPTFSETTVNEYIVPVLKYARARGVRSQLNSNVTMDRSRYEPILPYLDVLHVSFNYLNADDFRAIGFAKAGRDIAEDTARKVYERMVENIRSIAASGMFVSAESMINYRTAGKLADIHEMIVEMGCLRHEVHPMYASSFAADLPVLPIDRIRGEIHRLLDRRNRDVWMLFGTLPFYQCSDLIEDRELLDRLRKEPNVTVRNDPDGRNRLNVNLFTGDVFVTDFASVPPLGSIHEHRLDEVFQRWLDHPLCRSVNCHCPEAACCGPNLLVADMYYPEVDFKSRKTLF
ncbi:radical SAM/CxCxxxxC motif protein YfkAB [Ferviditalea candida]